VQRAKKILDDIGLGGERLDMFFMSGSQGHAFAMAAQTMTERIRKLGPNPLKAQSGNGKPKKPDSDEDIEEEAGYRGRKPDKDTQS
jgi:F420-non-reducing hydrogenase iron-sulfur subunit